MLADVFANNIGLLLWGGVMLFYLIDREGGVKEAAKGKLVNALMRWLK